MFKNELITYDEYIENFNEIYLINIYNEIEVIDVLFSMANLHFEKSRKNVQTFIENKRKLNPVYNISLKELQSFSLFNYLIYLYSAAIALSIYSQYKDNVKKGLNIATEIMKEINTENEEKLLATYNINFEEAIDSFIETNYSLVKKKQNKKVI